MSLFYEVLYWLIKNCLYVVDCIMEVFSALSGLTQVTVAASGAGGQAQSVNLLEYVLTNSSVQTVFLVICGVSLFIAFCFTMVSIIKNSVVTKHKSHGKTVFQFLMTGISTMLTVFGLFAFIWLSSEVLVLIDYAFNIENSDTLGQTIMEICAGKDIDWGDKAVNGFAFEGDGAFFGDLNPAWMGILHDVNTPGTNAQADITTFNFLVAAIVAVALIIVMIQAVIGLTGRIFNVVFLFLCAPIVIATVPLDDGARFKLWRETAISKVLLAYGTVIAVNVFILILPLITNNLRISGDNLPSLVNDLFRLVLILGGAFTIPAAQLLFSRLLGTQAEESREGTSGFRSMFTTMLGAGRMIGGAKRMVFGGTNRYGKKTKGALGAALGVGAGATNLSGSLLGGNAYRSAMSRGKEKMGNLRNTLRGNFGKIQSGDGQGGGKFMQGNGLAGAIGRGAKKIGNAIKGDGNK